MKNFSYLTEGNKAIPLMIMFESKMKNNNNYNFNIKGLKIAKSLMNFEEWDLNFKNEKNNIIEDEIEKLKENKKNLLFKNNLQKIILKEEKTLKLYCKKSNCHSFDFDIFSKNKNNDNNNNNDNCSINKSEYKLKNKLNKIPHPNNNNHIYKSMESSNIYSFDNNKNEKNSKLIVNSESSSIKDKNNNYLELINNYNKNYLDNYQDILNERNTFELKMHSYIMDLSKYLTDLKNNLNNLNNKDNTINNIRNNRRKSAASAIFGFTPKKEVKKKIMTRNEKLNILNYQLTDNLTIYNCKGAFNNIPRSNYVKQEKFFLNKDKIKRAEKEIEKTEKQLIKCIKSIKNYYLSILKKSTDIRKEGIIWVIKRLLRLNYIPKKNEFPEFIDEKIYNYAIKISNQKNQLYDLVKEYEELNSELLNEKEFFNLQKRINQILEENNNENTFNLNEYFKNDNKSNNSSSIKKRYYSANNNKKEINEDKSEDSYLNKKFTYLERKYNKYSNEIFISKLPEELQALLYFINNNINKLKENSDKKNIDKDSDWKNLSLKSKKHNTLEYNIKNIKLNKREIYSNKIKLKNRFFKLTEKEKWINSLKIRRKSVGDIMKQKKNNEEIEKKCMELFDISLDTYIKIERFIMLKLKINEINSKLKKEKINIEKYLISKKNTESYINICKFIFGNKIK